MARPPISKEKVLQAAERIVQRQGAGNLTYDQLVKESGGHARRHYLALSDQRPVATSAHGARHGAMGSDGKIFAAQAGQ